jgi:hypothetical protein
MTNRKAYITRIENELGSRKLIWIGTRPGRVRSLLLVGLEPLEETLEAVGELFRRGCDPVLSPFRPDPHTPLQDAPPPTLDFLEEAYDRAIEIVDLHGGALGSQCIPCMHNTLTFPDGSEHYSLTEKPSLSALGMGAS